MSVVVPGQHWEELVVDPVVLVEELHTQARGPEGAEPPGTRRAATTWAHRSMSGRYCSEPTLV